LCPLRPLCSCCSLHCTKRRPHRRGNGYSLRLSPLLQYFNRRQLLAFEEFEEGAAAGGDVVDAIADAVFGDGGQRVAAAGERVGGRVADGARDGFGAVAERLQLEYTDGAVPH